MSTVAEVMNQIKNDKIGSIYLILGKERYCSEEIKNALLGKLSPQEKEFNSSIYDMEETPPGICIERCDVGALFWRSKNRHRQ